MNDDYDDDDGCGDCDDNDLVDQGWMNFPINYVRLERINTDSYITYHLPKPMMWKDRPTYDALNKMIRDLMPGWELVSACKENPDGELADNDYWPN